MDTSLLKVKKGPWKALCIRYIRVFWWISFTRHFPLILWEPQPNKLFNLQEERGFWWRKAGTITLRFEIEMSGFPWGQRFFFSFEIGSSQICPWFGRESALEWLSTLPSDGRQTTGNKLNGYATHRCSPVTISLSPIPDLCIEIVIFKPPVQSVIHICVPPHT